MSWLGSIGGFLTSMWTSVYGLFSNVGRGNAATDNQGPGMISSRNVAGHITGSSKRNKLYPASNLDAATLAGALQYITQDDTAPVCLVLGQSCSAMRDRISSHVFAQLHDVVRYTRCTPEQDDALLKLFSKARPATADIHTLTLREVRAKPVEAMALVAGRCPLQLKTLDIYKSDFGVIDTAALAQHISACQSLTSVTLSDCHIQAPTISSLMPALLLRLPNLKKLDLSGNHMRVDGAVAIASLDFILDPSKMSEFKMTTLEHLDLGGNSLGNRGLEALLRVGFPGHATPALNVLDLRDNALQDDGARTLVRFLATFRKDAKPAVCGNLKVLDLSNNGISSDEGEPEVRSGFRGGRIFL